MGPLWQGLYLGQPKLLNILTVNSDGRTKHVPNLIHCEKKYHPYFLKIIGK